MAALLRGVHRGVAGPHGRRDDAALLELAQIDEIERRDAGSDPIRSHARKLTARKRQSHQIELTEDVVSKSRVRASVECKGRQIAPIVFLDFPQPIPGVALDRLALAKHGTCNGIERVILHAHECSPQQVDAIEDHAARDGGLTAPKVTLCLAKANRADVPPEVERMVRARGDAFQHGEVKVDGIPTRQHVRIECQHPIAEGLQRRALIRAARGSLGHGATAAIDDQHLVDFSRIE